MNKPDVDDTPSVDICRCRQCGISIENVVSPFGTILTQVCSECKNEKNKNMSKCRTCGEWKKKGALCTKCIGSFINRRAMNSRITVIINDPQIYGNKIYNNNSN